MAVDRSVGRLYLSRGTGVLVVPAGRTHGEGVQAATTGAEGNRRNAGRTVVSAPCS
jgi:hypothetical protein